MCEKSLAPNDKADDVLREGEGGGRDRMFEGSWPLSMMTSIRNNDVQLEWSQRSEYGEDEKSWEVWGFVELLKLQATTIKF